MRGMHDRPSARITGLAAIVALSLSLSACASAQPPTLGDITPGTELRLTSRTVADTVENVRLIRQVNGSIDVSTSTGSPPQRIPLADLERLEVVDGRSLYPATLVGASAGGLGGLIAGMICSSNCAHGSSGSRIYAPLVGIGIGSLIGAIIGAIRAPPRWVRVRIR